MKALVFVSLIAFSSTAAIAQTAPAAPVAGAPAAAAPTVGATVTGKDGQAAGTIAQITPQAVVIDTGANKVPVPPTSIGTSPQGPTIGMTKAELDAAYAQAAQQAQASFASQLTPGKMVHGMNGAMLGKIKSSDGQNVTVTTPKGDVALPASGFGPGENGTVKVGITAAQLDAALAGGGAAAPAADAPAATAADGAATTESTATTDAATTDTAAADVAKSTKKAKKPKR